MRGGSPGPPSELCQQNHFQKMRIFWAAGLLCFKRNVRALSIYLGQEESKQIPRSYSSPPLPRYHSVHSGSIVLNRLYQQFAAAFSGKGL